MGNEISMIEPSIMEEKLIPEGVIQDNWQRLVLECDLMVAFVVFVILIVANHIYPPPLWSFMGVPNVLYQNVKRTYYALFNEQTYYDKVLKLIPWRDRQGTGDSFREKWLFSDGRKSEDIKNADDWLMEKIRCLEEKLLEEDLKNKYFQHRMAEAEQLLKSLNKHVNHYTLQCEAANSFNCPSGGDVGGYIAGGAIKRQPFQILSKIPALETLDLSAKRPKYCLAKLVKSQDFGTINSGIFIDRRADDEDTSAEPETDAETDRRSHLIHLSCQFH